MIIKYKKLNADITPEVLGQLEGEKFILESAHTRGMKGRFSIVGFNPYGFLKLYDDELVISKGEEINVIKENPYIYLESFINEMKETNIPDNLKHLPFLSGLIGYCSFDLIRHQNKILRQFQIHGRHADVSLKLVESVYVFDHFKEELFVITTNLFSQITEYLLEERLDSLIEKLKNIPTFQENVNYQIKPKIETNISEEEFIKEVEHYKRLISIGDMFQVVPSRIYRYKHYFPDENKEKLKLQLYKNLKRQNPSPYMYYLDDKNLTIIGSSPESFIKKTGKTITTNPIAGTIKRGRTPEEDEINEKLLINDEKELSEHRMLVDLGRNDIHQISKPGTVYMPQLMTIEKFEHVMHIVSVVEGEIRPEITPLQMITALLPAGTVSGAPKTRAISRIYEKRDTKRGIYAGGIGYINCNHNIDFALTIRTMLVDEEYIQVEAGCGVVYDSQPEKELNETKIKAKSLLEVRP